MKENFPKKSNEIVTERSGTYIKSPAIGESITYNDKDYEVVGIVGNPWYFSKDKEVTEAGFGWLEMIVYFDLDNWTLPVYTDAMIKVKANIGLDTFSDKYKENTKKVKQQITDMSENNDWYLLDRQMNVGLVLFKENSNKINAISNVFPPSLSLLLRLLF